MSRKQIIQTDGDCVIVITPDQTVNATGYHYVVTACGELIESVAVGTIEEALQRARLQWLEEFDRFGQYDEKGVALLSDDDPTFDLMISGVVKTLEV